MNFRMMDGSPFSRELLISTSVMRCELGERGCAQERLPVGYACGVEFSSLELSSMTNKSMSAIYPSLEDRFVVVTGGASGIGAAIVEAVAIQKSQVVFLDVQDDAAKELNERLEGTVAKLPIYYRCDLTNIEAVQRTVSEVVERFPAIDVLVNNAGNDTRHS